MDQTNVKTKVLFENLSSKTTTSSLEAYLSEEYQVQICRVPSKLDANQGYGSVIFFDEANVNKLMNNRPHRIDGKEIEIYRSVSGQGSLKEKKGVKNLIVFGIKDKLSGSDLKKYFGEYGTINNIDMEHGEDSCCIQFKDYDSVDKALLNNPHTIHQVKIELKKGDRNYQVKPATGSSGKIYSIHITKIPSKINAETLSKLFEWSIYDILMGLSFHKHLLTECWLKNIHNKQVADHFIEKWNGTIISGSKIECQIEEDKNELCRYFQVGQCSNSDDNCDWQHIMCPEYGTCLSSSCLYGHAKGVKPITIVNKPNETYRIKITGFQTSLTPQLLAQLLDYENKTPCYVNKHEDQVGYIVYLKTLKFSHRLMKTWHNKELDGGHKLKCQLELNRTQSKVKPIVNTISGLSDSDSYRRSSSATDSSRDSFPSSNDSDFDGESIHRSLESIIKSPEFNAEREVAYTPSSTNSKLQLPSNILADKWEITKKVEESNEQVLLIREKVDRKRFAVLKIYRNNNLKEYNTELQALQILKDINNVSHLIDYSSDKNNFWIMTERASGFSLKKFIERIYRKAFEVLEAIELVQKLLIIIKQVHSQGIYHRNLSPEHIMIDWDFKQTSIEHARLTLINFSQAYNITLGQTGPSNQRWHQQPQELKYSPTIDASNICAIFFCLLTNSNPIYGDYTLPHQDQDIEDIINRKTSEAIRIANLQKNQTLAETQLKTYLIDTFNIGFSYPECSPWTIDDLECRLESIRELLLPTNPKLNTTALIFQELLSISTTYVSLVRTTVDLDIFETAANAFYQAKTHFLRSNGDRYLWSDGSCTWVNMAQISMNERQHDDILTYHVWNRGTMNSTSIIITCFATVSDKGNIITLSIGSPVNGKMIRIPIGQYSKAQNYMTEFQDRFITELNSVLISICKQRKAIQQ